MPAWSRALERLPGFGEGPVHQIGQVGAHRVQQGGCLAKGLVLAGEFVTPSAMLQVVGEELHEAGEERAGVEDKGEFRVVRAAGDHPAAGQDGRLALGKDGGQGVGLEFIHHRQVLQKKPGLAVRGVDAASLAGQERDDGAIGLGRQEVQQGS